MKKIEAVIDRAGLEALEIQLARAGIEGRPTLTQISIIETLGRYYGLRGARDARWKPCVKLDLIVSDCETQSAVDTILQHANLARSGGCGGYIDILPLDVTREISARANERRPGIEGRSERLNPFERSDEFASFPFYREIYSRFDSAERKHHAAREKAWNELAKLEGLTVSLPSIPAYAKWSFTASNAVRLMTASIFFIELV